MLDTVLNLGLNDESVEGLARTTGNERFAWDSYRRFAQMFGNVCRGVPGERYEDAIKEQKADGGRQRGRRARHGRTSRRSRRAFKELFQERDRRGVPAGPAGAAPPGDHGGVRLVDGQARGRVPPHQPHPGRLGHGGERAADGVRQQGRQLVLGRGLLARRDHGRAHAVRRLPAERAGRGRGVRRPHAARPARDEGVDAGGLRGPDGDPPHARAPLRRHAGHGVHGGGGPPLHAPDAQREAAGAGRGALRGRRRGGGPARQGAARSPRSTPTGSTRCSTRASAATPSSTCWPRAWPPRPAPRRARSCSPPTTPCAPRRTGAT